MPEPLMNYPNMCGSCEHFSFLVIGGELKYRGHCDCAPQGYFMNNIHGVRYRAKHSSLRQASTKACKRYKESVVQEVQP